MGFVNLCLFDYNIDVKNGSFELLNEQINEIKSENCFNAFNINLHVRIRVLYH